MTRALLALAVVFGISAAFAGDEPPPDGMTVLTVSGLIGKTNRGPFDPKRDSFCSLCKKPISKLRLLSIGRRCCPCRKGR